MALEFRSGYWGDAAARAEFLRFTRQMHRLDLTAWHELGYWDERYTPFSFFDGGRMVSNVCVYLLPMVVAGRQCVVPQVSAVGTEPEWRRRGLNRELTERAFAWCRGRAEEFSFLFADEEAFPFYRKCGFRRVGQHRFTAGVPPRSAGGSARLLDMEQGEDRALLVEVGGRRTAVSDRIGCLSVPLLMFHALYTLRDCAYWIEEVGVVVFARVTDGILRVFDVVGPEIPPLDTMLLHLPEFDAGSIELMFMPDKLQLRSVRALGGDDPAGTHIGGRGFPYEAGAFRFPFTAHA